MDKPMVSVIVPVYKAEKYLHECIDSILDQTYTNFELILVDDGSPDRCPKICDEYARFDKRIRVIHKENGGVSAARNEGIRQSNGKYLMFVDSDDYLDGRMLELMINHASENPDCIISGLRYVYNDPNKNKAHAMPDAAFDIQRSLNTYFAQMHENYGFAAPFAKLYRSDIIKDHKLLFEEEFSILEDGMFVYAYLERCRNCKLISEVLYNYRQADDESLMKKYNENADQAILLYRKKSQWITGQLCEKNLEIYQRRIVSQYLSFIIQIYSRSSLSRKEKYRLLKRYSEVGKLVVNDRTLHSLPFKKRVFLFLLMKDCVWPCSVLLYRKYKPQRTESLPYGEHTI